VLLVTVSAAGGLLVLVVVSAILDARSAGLAVGNVADVNLERVGLDVVTAGCGLVVTLLDEKFSVKPPLLGVDERRAAAADVDLD